MPELLTLVKQSMRDYFGEDQCRIEHALEVLGWAEQLLNYVDADPETVLLAACLHDIGLLEAERKHQSNAGQFQEIEGPPIARQILTRLNIEASLIDRICELVGHHHTPNGVDSPEFRILWDAEALVNLGEIAAQKTPAEMSALLHKNFVTEAGYRLAMKKYLPADSLAPHLQTGR